MKSRFEEVLARSQKLSTQLNLETDSTIFAPTLRRGIPELESARSIGLSAFQTLDEQQKINAVRLLAQKNFDALGLSSQLHEIVTESQYDSEKATNALDIDAYLSHHHDLAISSTIDDSNRMTEEFMRSTQRKQVLDDWSSKRKNFTESLGHVTQHWNRMLPGGSSSDGMLLIEASRTPSKGVGRQSVYSASDIPSLRSQSALGSQLITNGSLASLGGLSTLAQGHAAVIKKLSQSVRSPAPNVCSSFLSLSKNIDVDSVGITGVDENGLSKADLIGYKSALELLANMTGETRYKKIPPGLFSAICFNPKVFSDSTNLSLSVSEKKHFLALGAKEYLELQQLKLDIQEIDEAIQSGRVSLSYAGSDGQTRKQRLKSYIRHMHRTGNMYVHDIDPRDIAIFPDESAGSISDGACPLWPFIYYCLIWGDLQSAIDELTRCGESRMSIVEPEIITVLQIFRSLLQPYMSAGKERSDLDANEIKSKLFVKDITLTKVKQLSTAMSVCHELYQRELNESDERGIDPYRLLILNLVSLSDKEILTDPGISHHVYTMQTYLWANVWFSIFERWSTLLVHGESALQKVSFSMDKGENWFYKSILDVGGVEHFDAHRNNPLKYTLALLCCHRNGDAVSHLWQASKFLPAVHIAVVCTHYGLLLPHLPLSQNPLFPHPMLSSDRSAGGEQLMTLPTMLQLYLNVQSQRMFPELCADFFISVDVNWYQNISADFDKSVFETNIVKSRNAFSTLFESFLMALDQGSLTRLVGEPSLEGKPSVGYLDQVLDRDIIHILLARCAFEVLHVKRDPETAIYFYKLSGRFLDALDELSTQLAGVVTTKEGSAREHWLKLATEFFDTYVRLGTGPLAEAVQQNGRTDLLNTFLQLLNVSSFISSYVEGNYLEALHIIDELGLLPSSESDVMNATQTILQLPPNAKIFSVLDDILLLTMECALHVIIMLRRDAQSVMLTVVQQNDRRQEMERVRAKAQAIVLFGTSISNRLTRPDTLRMLTTMITNSGL